MRKSGDVASKSPKLLARYEREDAAARRRINPDTGKPFKNRNDLDTYRRNLKARERGYTSRAQERRRKESPVIARAKEFGQSWKQWLGGQRATVGRARDFIDAFGTQGTASPEQRKARADFLDSEQGSEWDWKQWQEDYKAVFD